MSDHSDASARVGADLLKLQAEDLLLDQLAYRRVHLPEREELATLTARADALRRVREGIESDRRVLTARTEALEVEIAESERRLELLDERSRSGAVASFRDQEALAIEIAAVAKRKGELEDSELEIMEELEPHDVALAANDAEIARILEARRTCTDRIASAEEEIALEETTVRSRREEAAARVPEPLLSEYERLRAHLGGIGVARVVGGNCSGCNLHLSATELDRIGHLTGPALEHCDQCGRLLVL